MEAGEALVRLVMLLSHPDRDRASGSAVFYCQNMKAP